MRDEKKVPEYITVSHNLKLPYSNWPAPVSTNDLSEQNQLAWDETRALMQRLAQSSKQA